MFNQHPSWSKRQYKKFYAWSASVLGCKKLFYFMTGVENQPKSLTSLGSTSSQTLFQNIRNF